MAAMSVAGASRSTVRMKPAAVACWVQISMLDSASLVCTLYRCKWKWCRQKGPRSAPNLIWASCDSQGLSLVATGGG